MKQKLTFLEFLYKNLSNTWCQILSGSSGYGIFNNLYDKLDGIGSVDNRPSNDKLYHFVQKKFKINVTRDMGHVTHDT